MGTGDSIKSRCLTGNIGMRGETQSSGLNSDNKPSTAQETIPGSTPITIILASHIKRPTDHTQSSTGSHEKSEGKDQAAPAAKCSFSRKSSGGGSRVLQIGGTDEQVWK